MTEKHSLIAFLAVLGAIVVLYAIGAALAFQGKPVEALGLGGAGTGLIGLLGAMTRSRPTSNVEKAETVNQGDAK